MFDLCLCELWLTLGKCQGVKFINKLSFVQLIGTWSKFKVVAMVICDELKFKVVVPKKRHYWNHAKCIVRKRMTINIK